MNTVFFTGAGDDGVVRVGSTEHSKAGPLFDVLGQLDSTNSLVGWVRVVADGFTAEACLAIQEMLFVAQAEVASRGFGHEPTIQIKPGHTTHLEQTIAHIDAETPRLASFVIPGGTEVAARLDVARTAARTLERSMVRAAREGAEHTAPDLLVFLNRLSSVLFALARYENHRSGVTELHPGYTSGGSGSAAA